MIVHVHIQYIASLKPAFIAAVNSTFDTYDPQSNPVKHAAGRKRKAITANEKLALTFQR